MLNFFESLNAHKQVMVSPREALPGRAAYPYPLERTHLVLGTDMLGPHAPEAPRPWPAGTEEIVVAGGCFWGIERIMWRLATDDGLPIHTTAAGYAGGFTAHPTYEETCTAKTGHTEAVLVAYQGGQETLRRILEAFWSQHDPTTPNRQGNDVGTQYRSAVYTTTDAQLALTEQSLAAYQEALTAAGRGRISTEVAPLATAGDGTFYYAEGYHQQYLQKVPDGYCNHGFNGVACSIA
jgi:peptide-methionine (S)-S-oxide reductase